MMCQKNNVGFVLVVYRWKPLFCVLISRQILHLKRGDLLPESQSGFRARRGAIDVIQISRQLA